ncbi:hypothetical protein DIPPA_11668 [Diplonema papillatum]|nr:hypothetical protein DIPPA_11668 [Diplonema papillatum]
MGAYRFIYQLFMYRTSSYVLGVCAMCYGFEQFNRSLSYQWYQYCNDGFMQYQLRRQVTDMRAAEGESSSWAKTTHYSIPSPNKENFELKMGEPRYEIKPSS